MEAFERLVVGVQSHPLSFLLPSDAEAIGRAALANGLTADQAKAIRKNLDTNAERARVKVILMQVVSFADAKLLLGWVLAEVTRALPPSQGSSGAAGATAPADGHEEAQEAPDPTGPRIVSIKHRGKWDVFIRTEGCDDWPIKDGEKKDTQGKLYIAGVFVDSMRPDQMHGALKELENAFGVGEQSINAKTGAVLPVVIKSFHGKETAVFPWAWPFAAV
jgi:hypothetical protein